MLKQTRLLVRLPNWIGDTLMALPSLVALREQGFDLILVGKAWAPHLLQGFQEQVEIYPKKFTERVGFLRKLAKAKQCQTMVLFTNSFSSAMEAKVAGLVTIGFKHEARTLLLGHRLQQNFQIHQVHRFWLLAQKTVTLFGAESPLALAPPRSYKFPVPQGIRLANLKQVENIDGPYVVLCPFSTGTNKGLSRLWPSYAELIRRCQLEPALKALHWVVCPGPKEALEPSLASLFTAELAAKKRSAVDRSKAISGQLLILENIDLLQYAALMETAHCVIANDSGPSHLAAFTTKSQITIIGPGDPAETGPWNPEAIVLGGKGTWPSVDQVIAALPPLAARP